MLMSRFWHKAFLVERPSISLSLFRFAVAFTVGAHMLPSLLHLDENYLNTGFRTKNDNFFPVAVLRFIDGSPDWLVIVMTAAFAITLATFTLGLFTQASCILMTLTCYYFYALNNYHIGTLSFDILLVTLVLMCLTGYAGDALSVDALRRGDAASYRRLRPFFAQRLLQLQLVITFWHTALNKFTSGGNWLTGNPWHDLMHYPPIGVVREFPFRAWLGAQPELCYGIGIGVIVFELLAPLLWWIPRTRPFGIALGILFQLMLWVTLHVPTIFLFLFPPMMLLFIAPEQLVGWIEARQQRNQRMIRPILLYDGHCGFCLASIQRLRVLDLWHQIELRDFHTESNLMALHPELTPERCQSEMVLLEPDGRLSGGFGAFRRLALRLPLLWLFVPLVYVPGASWIGSRVYRWVATHRYLLHRNPTCTTNQCTLPHHNQPPS